MVVEAGFRGYLFKIDFVPTGSSRTTPHKPSATPYTMGGSTSKPKNEPEPSFGEYVKKTIDDEIAKKMMLQREIQLAVNIAKARDTLWIFGTAWACLLTGFSTAHALGRKPPALLAVPIVVGGLALGNMADMAYGTKLNRVTKEAEYILEHERARFVPFRQAPFFKYYGEEEKSRYYAANAVGDLFPNPYIFQPWRQRPAEK